MDTQLDQTEARYETDSGAGHELVYRSISKAAVGAGFFALLSLLFLVSQVFFILPVIGVGR